MSLPRRSPFVFALALSACAGTHRPDPGSPGAAETRTTPPPSSAVAGVPFAPGGSYVWRVTSAGSVVRTERSDDPEQPPRETPPSEVTLEDELRVHVRADGTTRMGLARGTIPLVGPAAELLPSDLPGTRTWSEPGMGETWSSVSPDVTAMDVVSRDPDGLVRIARTVETPASTRYNLRVRAEGVGARAKGVPRYASLRWTTHQTLEVRTPRLGKFPSFDVTQRIELVTTLTYDAERSQAYAAERGEIARRAKLAERDLGAWLAQNGPSEEIARAARGLKGGMSSLLAMSEGETRDHERRLGVLHFHLGARTDEVVAALFADRASLDMLPLPFQITCHMAPDMPLGLLRHPELPAAREMLAACADERLRPELTRMSKAKGPLAAEAAKTLTKMDLLRAPARALAKDRDAGDLGARLTELVMAGAGQTGVELVGALVSELDRATSDVDRSLLVQWLEALTLAPHGKDVVAWRGFWATHAKRPAVEWNLEAARSPVGTLRAAAYQHLAGETKPPPAIFAALTEGLADVRPAVRISAASALVRLGDPRGVPPLLDALEGDLTDRGSAFLALAPRMPVTFGFDWKAPHAERAEALARIRAWAAREGLDTRAHSPD
jgi:hypothetical protein